VARATTYSGKVVRMVHVFSDAGLAEYAEHCFWTKGENQNEKRQKNTSTSKTIWIFGKREKQQT